MNVLLTLNDPPYGTERSYNGLRLAGALKVFLLGDAVACGKRAKRRPKAGTTWSG